MTSTDSPDRYALTGHLISPGRNITQGIIAVEGNRIAFAGDVREFSFFDSDGAFEMRRSPEGTIIIPGLIDLHCHGAAGGDFSSADREKTTAAIEHLHRSGTTTLMASLVTASRENMLAAAAVLAEFAQRGEIAGLHAEGPFLSTARCGAQDPSFITEPDPDFVDALIDAAAGQLRTMTYAPELEGSNALLEQLVSQGVVPSLGHTDADATTTRDSLLVAREELASAGVDGFTERPTVTHLFNGMPPMHHRAPGPIAACLELASQGKIIVELIADGVHLDPDMVRTMFEVVGAEAIALVTDSMAATGLADGNYELGSSAVSVTNGEARLASDGSLAGGTASMLDVLRKVVAAGVGLDQAIISATKVPASVLGLVDEAGRLHRGFAADMLILNKDLELVQVIRNGVYLG